MGLNFKILVIWKALSTMPPKVAVSATSVMPKSRGFGSSGSNVAPAIDVSTSARPATSTISSGSAASPKADHSVPKSDPKSSHRMAGGGSSARVESSSTPRSDPKPAHRVATHSEAHSEDFVSRADFEKLQRQFGELKATATKTGSRLTDVEKDVKETKGDTKQILALLTKGKKEQKTLPAPPKRRTTMSPTNGLMESSESESESISEYESDEYDQVPYGPDNAFTSTVVTKWGQRKTKSTPVACKGGSSAASSSSSSSSDRKDLSRAAGGGAMVIASKSRQQPLPLPETLGRSGKERSSSPRIERLHGTGLVLCADLNDLVASMKRDGYTEVPMIVRKTKGEISEHFKTAIVNAHDLGDDEAKMLALLSADSGRSATRISDACQIRNEVIDCFSAKNVGKNVGMFMTFFARMAENYHSRSDKGVEISGRLYPYVVLGTDKTICTSFLKYLRDN